MGDLILTAIYLFYRMSHFGLEMKTPFRRVYGMEADLSNLKSIGARAFVYTKDAN